MFEIIRNRNKYRWIAALLFLLLLISACKSRVAGPEKIDTPFDMKKILIFPFQDMSKRYGENLSIRCPVCGARFTIGTVGKDAAGILTGVLMSYMKNRTAFHLMPASREQEVLLEKLSRDDPGRAEVEILIGLGRELGVDGVMVGHVYRYRERIGSRYSVERPASVAFDVDLVNVKDGGVVWVGSFNETQQSLSENLFRIDRFIKRKGRWATAKEMAVSGLESELKPLRKK